MKATIGCALACGALAWSPAAAGQTGAPVVLDRDRVVALAARGPAVVAAEARLGEARAARVGASAWLNNPELSVLAGPRWLHGTSERSTDVVASLLWPIDLSGAPSWRREVAEARVRVAEGDAAEARRLAVGTALDTWVRAVGADRRVALEGERVELDEALVRIARVRQSAGVAGNADLALATVMRAEAVARRQGAEGERAALGATLLGLLGLPQGDSFSCEGTLVVGDPPPLAALVAGLGRRGDVQRAVALAPVVQADRALQDRLRTPVPRALLGGGRENETFARVGIDVPLPVHQRNQTNRAVAAARVDTAAAERISVDATAEAELRAAYATFLATQLAWRTLDEAIPAAREAERLATRGYELGGTPLGAAITARREATIVRGGHLDAAIALARARVAVDRAAGLLP